MGADGTVGSNADHQRAYRARRDQRIRDLEAEVARLRGTAAPPGAKKATAAPEPPRPTPPPPPRSQAAEQEIATLKQYLKEATAERLRLAALAAKAGRVLEIERQRDEARAEVAALKRRPPGVAESEAIAKLEALLKAAYTKAGKERARANTIARKAEDGPTLSDEEVVTLLKACHPDRLKINLDDEEVVADMAAKLNVATQILNRKRDALKRLEVRRQARQRPPD